MHDDGSIACVHRQTGLEAMRVEIISPFPASSLFPVLARFPYNTRSTCMQVSHVIRLIYYTRPKKSRQSLECVRQRLRYNISRSGSRVGKQFFYFIIRASFIARATERANKRLSYSGPILYCHNQTRAVSPLHYRCHTIYKRSRLIVAPDKYEILLPAGV